MNSDAFAIGKDLDLVRFAARFLKEKGAILETRGEITDAFLPQDLSCALNVEEYISLAPGTVNVSESKEYTLYTIQFQSPLLDKIASMAGSKPPFLKTALSFHYIKTQGFANLIQEQFEFFKSKPKITGTGEMKTRYILLTCKFLAQSDEQKEGLMDFSFNMDTGTLASGMLKMLPGIEKEYQVKDFGGYTKEEIRRIHELVNLYSPDILDGDLSEFRQSMNRRFKRDYSSLDAYYMALEKEMQESLLRTGISDRLIQEREAKIAMIPDELAAKKKDLLNKYSIRISITPVAALEVVTPCVKVFVTLVSGHRKKNIFMMYNPVTKQMDPMVCQSCGKSMFSLGLCKNMHLNCTTCLDHGCAFCQ
ncbi:MAG: hypothetical protein KKE62_12530 [Proteobacteria bacterium]|nr:hypothetical protein [Pseudomonadota bacterium]MBU1387213.1 hypothetical protein [Pseudomonadota bacterium]MBU1543657.1 hypothetical protein [Pseudomonadota bacterium]MBU2431736.1 hypothetical protein [Pseudomonadota bacterium]MBU2479862.1 hypothetical protein [Pseudomonadota bacterium]